MIKFRWYYDKDKEEAFLNNMVKKGYAMTYFFLGIYCFEKCKQGEYIYRIDIIRDKTIREFNEYCDLIRETGGELVQKYGMWAFFRKKGEFELYTDNTSKIEQYKRIQKVFALFAFIEAMMIPSQIGSYLTNKHSIFFHTTIFLSLICIIFIYQVYKCSIKIKELKDKL